MKYSLPERIHREELINIRFYCTWNCATCKRNDKKAGGVACQCIEPDKRPRAGPSTPRSHYSNPNNAESKAKNSPDEDDTTTPRTLSQPQTAREKLEMRIKCASLIRPTGGTPEDDDRRGAVARHPGTGP